jgi:hypothetical protein
MPDTARTLSCIAAFCNAHSHLTIHYYIPRFECPCVKHTVILESFIMAGISYSVMLTGKRPDIMHPMGLPWGCEAETRTWRDGLTCRDFRAPNLSFWPRMCGFDEREFTRGLEEMRRLNVPHGGELWAQAAKKWVENGI